MAAQPGTMLEALNKVISDISQAMVTPDADIQFLTQLQGVIVGRMRQGPGNGGQQPHPQGQPPMGGQMSPPPGQPPGPPQGGGGPAPGGPVGGPGGGGPPPGGPGQMQGPPSPNGVTPLAQAPNPDELRRMLAGRAGA